MHDCKVIAGMKFSPVKPRQISPCDYMGKSNFIRARWDSFPPGICLHFLTFFLVFFYKHVWNYFFIRLSKLKRLHGKLSPRQSGIPAVQKKDLVLPEWSFSHVIPGYNLCRVSNIAGITAKLNIISYRPTRIM